MESIKLPIPQISNTPTREEILSAFELFDSNQEYLQKTREQNDTNCQIFIENNRKIIKQISPLRGKVYRVIKKGGWVSNYSLRGNNLEDLIKYVFIKYIALTTKVSYKNFTPTAKAIALDENGKLIKYKSQHNGRQEEYTLFKDGDDFYISHLSQEDYPEILSAYKKYLKNNEDKELILFNKLKLKYNVR